MIDGGNGLTSWFMCFRKNKLTMIGGPLPLNPLNQLAESKVTTKFIKSHIQDVVARSVLCDEAISA
jgi:hypothetical protein